MGYDKQTDGTSSNCSHCHCKCLHHGMMPWFVIAFALVFLLGNLGVIGQSIVNVVWPTIVGLAGAQRILARRCRCC